MIPKFLPPAKSSTLLRPNLLSHIGRNVSGIISRSKRTNKKCYLLFFILSYSISITRICERQAEVLQLKLNQQIFCSERDKLQEHWIHGFFFKFQLLMTLAYQAVSGKLSEAMIQIFRVGLIEPPGWREICIVMSE